MSFKIFFKEKALEKNIIVKGEFKKFEWSHLKDEIINNSKRLEFKSKNKEIKDKDDFVLEFGPLPKNFDFPLSSVWNTNTYTYFVENLKIYQQNNPNEDIKIRLFLKKVEKLPKWSLPKYDAYLKGVLESTWTVEEKKIINKLNNLELFKAKFLFMAKSNKSRKKDIIHNNIICNSCLTFNIEGFRYVCSYCKNYNLCQKCFHLRREHNQEHIFILVKSPINDDITKYNNKFLQCWEVFKNRFSSFEIKIQIANIGEKDLKNCFISYIKFTGSYLLCEKFIITENFVKNEIKEIKLKIILPDEKDKSSFEGHFRMFNANGLPFGDVLTVKVMNDSLQ